MVFEVLYSETRAHAKRKLAHWFALGGVRHVIIVWIRNKPYKQATSRFPGGEKMPAGANPGKSARNSRRSRLVCVFALMRIIITHVA